MGDRTVRLAVVQLACGPARTRNLAMAAGAVEAAADQGANIVLLPELFQSRYFCQTEDPAHFDLAEPVDGPTAQTLREVAGRRGVVVVAPFFERRAAGLYHNSALVLDADGSVAGHYRKTHIPDDPRYYEKFYFTPGDLGYVAAPTRYGTIGVLICWDQWFPEAARLTALHGADLLVYPTAIGWWPEEKDSVGDRQRDAWETVQRGHAIANGLHVAAANRVGFEPSPEGGLDFWGSSFVAGPDGAVLARAGGEPETLLVDLDLARTETTRQMWPFLRDRRIDLFAPLAQRYLADRPAR